MRLENKVAVITGSGSGMGRTAALRFAAEGAKVVTCDVNTAGGAETLRQVTAAGGQVIFIPADVTRPEEVARLMREGAQWGGKIDILYNNAGIGPPTDKRATDLTEEAWHQILGVNLTGVFLCCKYGIPYLVENGGGSVINTASVAGIRANTALPSTAYTVSKAGVIALTRQCAVDYARQQVRVNAICPGPVDTPILDPFMGDPAIKQRFSAGVPIGRMGTTTDVVNLVLFLASDESSWMTGSIIVIDGGITAG